MVQTVEIRKVIEFINDIAKTRWNEKIPCHKEQTLEDLKSALNELVAHAHVHALAHAQTRLNEALQMITRLAALDFSKSLSVLGDGMDLDDGLAAGLNMLAEELEHSVVSRRELEIAEREFRSIYEQGASGIVFVSLEGRIAKCNERYASLYQSSAQEMKGKLISEVLVSAEEKPCLLAGLSKLISGELEFFDAERRIIRPDGSSIWCLMDCARIANENGAPLYIVAIFQEITERKQLQAALMNSAKLTALGEMAGGIAHEINNPVGIIKAKSAFLMKLIQRGRFTPELGTEELTKILETSDRIGRTVRGLRSFSRDADKDPFVPVPLKAIIGDVLGLCSEKFRSREIKLEVSAIPELTLKCRAVQIEQVLLNLLNNAHDAVESLPEKWIRIDFKLSGEEIQISVTDSGNGIPSEIAEKIMHPFFTTKEPGKGTGLGLSISMNIAAAHQGELFYDPESANTCFVIKLLLVQKRIC